MKKTVTLAELLIAIALLGTILLAVGVFEVGSLRMYHKQDYRVSVFSDIVFITQHLNKYIRPAIGDKDNPGIRISWTSPCKCTGKDYSSCNCYVEIRNDTKNTPSKYSDDIKRVYAYNSSNYELRFYPDITVPNNRDKYEVLSKRVVDCKFFFDINTPQIFRIDKLKLRYNPYKNSSQENPEVEISPISLKLFSFSHSLN